MTDANALKVAICDCLIAINDEVDPVTRDKWGPIIPPTSIDWIGDALVAAVLAISEPENVDTPAHDHELIWRGFDYEIPSFDLDCKHDDDDPRFHMDNEGNVSDECLTQQWFDNDGIYIIKNSDRPDSNSLPCWTTWDYEGVPTLMGLAQYKDWKDGHDDD